MSGVKTETESDAVPTYNPKPGEIERHWHVIDANDVILGRLASHAAHLLRGKHKPQFARHVDTGDFVIVINAAKVAVSGNKLNEFRYRHSGYPGGLSKRTVGELLESKPERVDRARRARHAAEDHARPGPAEEAEGLRRPRPPARGAEAAAVRDQAGIAVTTPAIPVVGRRKEAVVRARLIPGTGEFKLNGRTLDHYFPNKVHQQLIREPFVTLEKDGQYDVIASLSGGGVTGQAGALRLAIARALIVLEPDDRPALKKAGFLTRDPRVKERKKYGLKKARKAPQYSKR